MKDLAQHPTVQLLRERPVQPPPAALDAAWLRQLALDAGADDVGFVSLDRHEIADQRKEILQLLPGARTLIAVVCRMNRENIRTPARSVANLEFHHTTDHVNEVARRIVQACEQRGVRALSATAGFPMEADRWGGKMWVVSHKPIAVAAGLGQMGINRNVIHPRFGNFILLGTVILAAEVTEQTCPISYNPCLECKLCVAACPTGAIAPDGHFNFSACYTHNYREFMGGFVDWVHTVAASPNAAAYREKVSDAETVSMWQSLGFGPNYKAAYCMAVCPAGEDVISPFLEKRKEYLDEVVKPLQEKSETVYVLPNSDAEPYVGRRFPSKRTKCVGNGLRLATIAQFLGGLPLTFQPGQSAGLDATFHFTFTGAEPAIATVEIRDRKLRVERGHLGQPDFHLTIDSETWLKFLRKETNLMWAVLRGKLRFRGNPRLLLAFAKSFAG